MWDTDESVPDEMNGFRLGSTGLIAGAMKELKVKDKIDALLPNFNQLKRTDLSLEPSAAAGDFFIACAMYILTLEGQMFTRPSLINFCSKRPMPALLDNPYLQLSFFSDINLVRLFNFIEEYGPTKFIDDVIAHLRAQPNFGDMVQVDMAKDGGPELIVPPCREEQMPSYRAIQEIAIFIAKFIVLKISNSITKHHLLPIYSADESNDEPSWNSLWRYISIDECYLKLDFDTKEGSIEYLDRNENECKILEDLGPSYNKLYEVSFYVGWINQLIRFQAERDFAKDHSFL